MALYAKDRAQLSQSADALTALIVGDKQKRDLQAQAEKSDLEKLVRGSELEQEAITANEQRAADFAASQGLKPGKYSVSANQSGYGINPEPAKDPLELLLKRKLLEDRQEEKDDKAVQVLSKRVEGAQIGPSQVALQNLGSSVKQHGVALGPVSSALPAWMVSAGEQLGLADKGATEQKQSVEALQAFQRNPLFGASLTPGEQQSFNNAFGLLAGGSPEQRVQAMSTLQGLYNKAVANVGAGSAPRIREKYKAQGGIDLNQSDVFEQAPAGGMDPAKKSRLEQLRAKHKQVKP
jgi:hypothetical protein